MNRAQNKSGSSGRKTLVALFGMVLVAALGFGVVHFGYKPTAAPSSSASAALYGGWRSFSGQQLLFRYPPSWNLDKNTDDGSFVEAYSPASIPAGTVSGSSTLPARLTMSVTSNLSRLPNDCVDNNCQVLAVVPLQIKQASAKLVIYNVPASGASYSYLQVVDDSTLSLDSTSFKDGVSIGGRHFKISGQPLYGAPNPAKPSGITGQIQDLALFQKSAAYVQTVQLLNSLKLP